MIVPFTKTCLRTQQTGSGFPPKLYGEHLKFGLKFSVLIKYNFGGSGSNFTKLYQATCCEAFVINVCINFGSGAPTKFRTAKNVQNSTRFLTTFDLSANTSRMDRRNENLKSALSATTRPLLGEKMVNFGPLTKKVIGVNVKPLKWIFWGDYISAPKGCCLVKFLHALQPLNCIFSRNWGAGRPQVGQLCPIFLVSVCNGQIENTLK